MEHAVPPSTYNMPLPPNYGPAVTHVAQPNLADTVKYGQYLATIGHCMECHTPRDKQGRLVTARLGAGGQAIKWPGGVAITPNLTPDESGLKNWSDAQIEHAIRDGVNKNGARLQPLMAFDWYKTISAADMKALIAYLRSLPAQPSNPG